MVQDAKEAQKSAYETLKSNERLVSPPVDRGWILLLVSRLLALSDAARGRAERLSERLERQRDLSAALSAAVTPLDVANVVFERLTAHVGATALDLRWRNSDSTPDTSVHARGDAEDYATTHEIPLVVGGVERGVLRLFWDQPHRIDDEERLCLEGIAPVVAQAVERAHLLQAERHAGVQSRDRSERAVLEKQALVDLLARAVPQIIWITELPDVVFLNDRWTDYTGLPVADSLARGWAGLSEPIHPDDLAAVEQSWAAARASGETWQLEYRMRRHDGVYRWHLGRAVPHTEHGVIVRWVGTATDIEDLRRVEAEKAEEDAFRERLFGIAGHDLRNPLNAIVMAGALLDGRDELSAGSRKLVGRIRRSADRMTRLIGQLLDLSRIRSGAGLALVRTRVDLGELAREVADEARAGTPDALIAVRVLGDPVGEWDRDRVAQVVSNLLSNAIQHGRRGAPVGVTVDGERDPRMVRIEVVNEGDPIPEAERVTLFEPWKRGAGSRDRRTGAGLGLYIVHGVVTAHGGSVGVESDLLGTRVCLALPR